MSYVKTAARGSLLTALLALPFSSAIAGGKPPRVTNEPVTVAEVDSIYVYQVEAWDPEGDRLSYEIRNGADWSWLRWDPNKGRLHGEPTSADLGPHTGVRILVSDGSNTTEIGPFDINVVWSADKDDGGSDGGGTSWSSKKTRNPGHYVSMNRYDDRNDMLRAVKPGIRGYQIRYFWSDLEKSKGNYDFSLIRADLKTAASQGMQLVVFIEDKSFNRQIPTPSYLHGLTVENRNKGYTALRWKPYVVERFKALLSAMGREFDDHANFEGVAIQESSPSMHDWTLDQNGYSPAVYRDALIEMIRAARQSFPKSQVFWYMNFLPRNQNMIADIANVAANLDVAMGGPDVLPDSKPLKNLSYPFYDDFRWRMTLFNSMQYDSYAHERASDWGSKYWTMHDLFAFARDELHVDYLFWNRKQAKLPSDSYNWWDALPVIDNNSYFGNAN